MVTLGARQTRIPRWVAGVGPLVIIALLAAAFLTFNPIAGLREVPPVEAVSFERTIFEPGVVELHLRNDGPDEVTIAQVLVNDAYRGFSATDRTLGRLESSTVRIPYPWEEGLPVNVALVTSTGLLLDHDVEAAAETPAPGVSTLVVYGLLGVYVGVIPVAIGLLWFTSLRRASKKWLNFFLALTLGLLVFLLVDTMAEGLELATATAAALNGLQLFVLGAAVAVLGLTALEAALGRRRDAARSDAGELAPLTLAYLIAAGIGLHNLGEGLAIGAALAAGSLGLGTFLILGFALHNTTEGLAIVSPLGSAGARPTLGHFAGLGAVAGVPTILGAWIGGFAFTPGWAALAFGLAAGAIAQVLWQIGRSMGGPRAIMGGLGAAGFLAGFVIMYATGLLTP